MIYKILLGLIALILLELVNLFHNDIMKHKLAYGILKIVILNTILISVLALKSFYLNLLLKIKDVVQPIFETVGKILSILFKTPNRTSKKYCLLECWKS